MRIKYFILLFFVSCQAFCHSPDISSLMIYEQNGKTLLIVKGALTALQGEVDYTFKKNAFKTPKEFNKLVIKHFTETCEIVINGKKVNLKNIVVQLGHESNLFAEFENFPKKIETLRVKNKFFEDIPNNKSELVLMIPNLPQKQYILNAENNQEVNFKLESGNWVIKQNVSFVNNTFIIIFGLAVFLLLLIYIIYSKNKAKIQFAKLYN